MKNDEFLDLEYRFIDKLKSSALYKEYKELDEKIKNDKEIVSLASKRDELYKKLEEASEDERKELLIEAKKIDDALHSIEIVKRYDEVYLELKKYLLTLQEKINEVLR